jgi:hypothetical protein
MKYCTLCEYLECHVENQLETKRQHVVKMLTCYKNMAQILKGKESTKLP